MLESVRYVHIVCDRLKNVCFVKVSLVVLCTRCVSWFYSAHWLLLLMLELVCYSVHMVCGLFVV